MVTAVHILSVTGTMGYSPKMHSFKTIVADNLYCAGALGSKMAAGRMGNGTFKITYLISKPAGTRPVMSAETLESQMKLIAGFPGKRHFFNSLKAGGESSFAMERSMP